jgi:hypothetical protein
MITGLSLERPEYADDGLQAACPPEVAKGH